MDCGCVLLESFVSELRHCRSFGLMFVLMFAFEIAVLRFEAYFVFHPDITRTAVWLLNIKGLRPSGRLSLRHA